MPSFPQYGTESNTSWILPFKEECRLLKKECMNGHDSSSPQVRRNLIIGARTRIDKLHYAVEHVYHPNFLIVNQYPPLPWLRRSCPTDLIESLN